MKRKLCRSSQGSVFISAAMAAGVLAILIAGFLTYLSNEYNLNFRTHRWNQAFHLAEAATEIGIAEYNYQYTVGGSGFQGGNGWSGGGGTYTKTVSNLTDVSGNYTVGSLQITATGVTGSNAQFIGIGTVMSANYGGASLARAVQVRLAPSPMFPLGLVALSTINLNGNNVYTDSYDSSDTNKSTNGQYDANKKQPNGNIATDDTITNSVSIGNANIYGTVSTGPDGTVTMGPNGSIGPSFSSPATTVSAAQTAGWVQSSFDTTIPDVTLPAGFSTATSLGGINGNTTVNGSGYYSASSINLSGNKTLEITSGNVSLYVSGNTSVAGNASIIVDAGATLKIYAAGSMAIAGNGVANNAGLADDIQFYGLPTSTSWSIAGNGVWDGTVYAPEAALTISGGGSGGDVSGAFVTQSITLGGHVQFHYDESLKKTGPIVGYLAASWQELRYVGGNWVP